ncbi:MAG: DUF86 domain-containing protein [Promethearchaeota archaeon]
MKPERLKRYHDKINYIVDNLKDIPEKPKNDLEKKGIFYSLQTSIESTIDLVAMGAKDLGFQVQDDSTNINNIVKNRQLDTVLGEKLNRANGLRNILVHRYNGVDDQIILNSISEIKKLLFQWLDIIEGVINEKKSN